MLEVKNNENIKQNMIMAFLNYNQNDIASYNEMTTSLSRLLEYTNIKEDIEAQILAIDAFKLLGNFGYEYVLNKNKIMIENDFLINEKEKLYYDISKQLHSTELGNELDKLQMKIIEKFINMGFGKRRLVISAPTSFGKTFLLEEIIFRMKGSYNNIVLIFPTVSLLHENLERFQKFIKNNNLSFTIISNTFQEINLEKKNIFILTPERALKIISKYDFTIDLFAMDEIYKFDNSFNIAEENETSENNQNNEDDRDIVFRIALYYLTKKAKDIYLMGPFLKLETQDKESSVAFGLRRYLELNKFTTIQIDQRYNTTEYFSYWTKNVDMLDSNLNIIQRKIDYNENTTKENLLYKIVNNRVNIIPSMLIYVSRVFKTEEIASKIAENTTIHFNASKQLTDFIDHLKNRYSYSLANIEKKTTDLWALPNILIKGIGIHHGQLPKYIQKEILELFNNNDLKILITTTSITEGVNTNAKEIIIYSSKKGRNKNLKKFDALNIVGRSGRYYHHFINRCYILDMNFKKILTEPDQKLDLINYSDKELSSVDLDVTSYEDLTKKNRINKENREIKIKEKFCFTIPDNILSINRTFDNYKQYTLVNYLLNENLLTNNLMYLIYSSTSTKKFFDAKKNILKIIMPILYQCEIIEEHEIITLPAIAGSYYKGGIKNLFFYEYNNYIEYTLGQINYKNAVNSCFRSSFYKIKNVIEFQIPKLLSLFETLFNFSCKKRIHSSADYSLSGIINFMEFGVFSKIAMSLVDFGFPIETIRMIEREIIDHSDYNLEVTETIEKYKLKIEMRLDKYEITLWEKFKIIFSNKNSMV